MSESWQSVCERCGATKATGHTYMPNYERLLAPHAADMTCVVEVGCEGGGFLRAALELFPQARLHGIDLSDQVSWQHERVVVHVCDQTDPRLASLFVPGSVDLVIDDCSHHPHHQRRTRELLWDALKPGGWYFIEDIQDPRELQHWAHFPRFRVFIDYLRSPARTLSVDDILVVLRKEPCPLPWEW